MDWLVEEVRRAAPPALGSDAVAAEEAAAVARAVLAETPNRRGLHSVRRTIVGSVLGVGLLGLGVTAAVAAPTVFDWLGWTPDVVAQRSFSLTDGAELGVCEVFFRVVPEYGTVAENVADERTEAAREFLTEHDWEPLIASITTAEIQEAYELEVERRSTPFPDGTLPPPATLSGAATEVMYDRIFDEFEAHGYLKDGVSFAAAAKQCGDTGEGPTN